MTVRWRCGDPGDKSCDTATNRTNGMWCGVYNLRRVNISHFKADFFIFVYLQTSRSRQESAGKWYLIPRLPENPGNHSPDHPCVVVAGSIIYTYPLVALLGPACSSPDCPTRLSQLCYSTHLGRSVLLYFATGRQVDGSSCLRHPKF